MRTDNRYKTRLTTLAAAMALATAGGFALALPDRPASTIAGDMSTQQVLQGPKSFALLVERVKPAVVNVSTKGAQNATASMGNGFSLDDLPDGSPFGKDLREFFGQMFERPDSIVPRGDLRAAGSGFIISPEGYVVTSDHVIEHAEEITVVLDDGRQFPAQVQGRDPKTDLALLKIEADDTLPYVELGDSDDAKVGEWVVAVGNPFGLGGTVTAGILSARGRDIKSGPYHDYLQIDAPINRGNSGGPLFNTDGKVIGINTAIYSPSGGSVGIGFAVPASTAEDVIAELRTNGRVERAWLGVHIQPITPELAHGLDLPDQKGALIAEVLPDSPAAEAGLQVGDVIYEVNGQKLLEFKDLPRLVAKSPIGAEAQFEVWRKGENVTLTATLAPLASEPAELAMGVDEPGSDAARLGVYLSELTPEVRQQFDIAEERDGVLVIKVDPDSPAERAGLRSGDVIERVDQTAVGEPAEVAERVAAAAADERPVVLLIAKDDEKHFVAVKPAVG